MIIWSRFDAVSIHKAISPSRALRRLNLFFWHSIPRLEPSAKKSLERIFLVASLASRSRIATPPVAAWTRFCLRFESSAKLRSLFVTLFGLKLNKNFVFIDSWRCERFASCFLPFLLVQHLFRRSHSKRNFMQWIASEEWEREQKKRELPAKLHVVVPFQRWYNSMFWIAFKYLHVLKLQFCRENTNRETFRIIFWRRTMNHDSISISIREEIIIMYSFSSMKMVNKLR